MRWLFVLLAGCNVVYGLDETTVAPPDLDGDGAYGDDNCPLLRNPDQADGDEDGVGDACDTCPDVVDPLNHDEDADRIGDACDICETFPDFQQDSDGDGVGDECDATVSGARSKRLVFDPFFTVDPVRWMTTSTWIEHGDSVSASPEGTLILADGRVDTPYYHIDLGIESPDIWTAGDSFGVRLVDDGAVTMRCEARCDPNCRLVFENAGMQMVGPLPKSRPLAQLRVVLTEGNPAFFGCQVLLLNSGAFPATTSTRGQLEVVVGGQIRLAYVGAWTHMP